MVRRTLLSLAALSAVLAVMLSGSLGPVAAASPTPVLVEIRAAHHAGFDRIVFEFEGSRPEVAKAHWTMQELRLDPSDMKANVQGRAHIRVLFRTAVAHELTPPYESTALPHRRAYDLPNIAHVVQLGDAEGDVSYGIGLMKRTRILRKTMLKNPTRFVIDVATDFPKRNVKVFYIDEQASIDGDPEFVEPVRRKVPRHSKTKGALWRLWAGPTAEELEGGLVFIDSGTTGHRRLRINDRGIARLTLRGPCQTDGAAVTVADEIMPTLRSRPAIDWVKIYDREGTLYPTGKSDSLPACLQP